jgi:V/A-type H+-transporting ATPase subunit A
MDLPAIISNFYARAGLVNLNNGKTGSVTFIGTVSPAGWKLKEPVTESTKKSARCFYALSQNRADKKRYPAVDLLTHIQSIWNILRLFLTLAHVSIKTG